MATIDTLLTDHLDLWTLAIARKSSAGRSRSKKFNLHGIEKLRALILDLAVRGKLVPQDLNDEPASELLKRIAKNADILTSGAVRKSSKYGKEPKDRQYRLPTGWCWVPISDIGHDWGQTKPSQAFTYIDVGSIDQRSGRIREAAVLDANVAPSRARKCVREGTVIYSTVRPYLLNIAIVDRRFEPEPIASTAFAVIHPFEGISASYIYRYLRSPVFVSYVEGCQTGIAYPAINDKQFFSAWFPLPPEAEQRRIVAKVDELMALCDRLEAGAYEAIEAHQLLVTELLGTLTASRDAGELADNWARIEAHFDTLFDTEDSVDQLKQTTLQLAMMGRLVPQDPKDEPASDLLKRIRTNIANYAKTQGNPPLLVEAINTELAPFHLPNSWCWTRLSAVFNVITDGDHQAPPKASEGIAFLTIGNITTNRLDFEGCRFVSEEYFDAIPPYRSPAKGDILYTVVGATYGRPALVDTDRPFCVQRHIAILKPVENMNRRFLFLLLSSQLIYLQAKESITGTAQPTIPLRPLRNFLIPLPPLAEQARIVARIDRLMELCDALKSDLRGCSELQVGLADAFVARAVG